ncbi:MAG: gliding motility-associated C-terminal domain-containing protein, partial [Bacteroidia bacterium]
SAFSSVTDSVVVLLKPNKLKDSTYCLGQAQLNISKKAYDINWSDGSQGQFIIPENEGSYYATYKMPGGCSHRQDFIVDFDTLVLPKLSDTAFCDSGSLSFIKTKNHNYRWDNGHSSARKHFQTSGSHQLKVWLNQCIDSIAFDVTVEPTESLEFTDTTLCIGEAFVLEHNLSYLINYQNGLKDVYTDSTDIILTWQQPVCGEQTDTFKLRYKPCACTPYIATAFSPNSDGLNDEFRPVLDCEITFYNLRIYNRWGQEIFSTQEASESWQPQNIPLGQYYYLLSYKDAYTRKEHFWHGSISLIK